MDELFEMYGDQSSENGQDGNEQLKQHIIECTTGVINIAIKEDNKEEDNKNQNEKKSTCMNTARGRHHSDRRRGDGARDNLLFCSEASLRVAIQSAQTDGRCRYCWLAKKACICESLNTETKKIKNKSSTEEKKEEKKEEKLISPIFTVVCHPNECLRSTSTSKIAIMSESNQSRMLMYGSKQHRRLIVDVVKGINSNNEKKNKEKNEIKKEVKKKSEKKKKKQNEALTYVLFPEGPSERTCTVDEMMTEIRSHALACTDTITFSTSSPSSITSSSPSTSSTTTLLSSFSS